ncbi:MAG: hypothetical protein ACYC27_04965 [Armatimonadota bacterium]
MHDSHVRNNLVVVPVFVEIRAELACIFKRRMVEEVESEPVLLPVNG